MKISLNIPTTATQEIEINVPSYYRDGKSYLALIDESVIRLSVYPGNDHVPSYYNIMITSIKANIWEMETYDKFQKLTPITQEEFQEAYNQVMDQVAVVENHLNQAV